MYEDRFEHKVVSESYPLTEVQQGMLYTSISADSGSGYFIEQVVCSIMHPLNEELFFEAWRTIFNSYSVLATEFSWEKGTIAEQQIANDIELPIVIENCESILSEDRVMWLESFLSKDRCRGFVLDQAPLTRVTLLRWSQQEYQCIWTIHHAIIDGRSMAYVLRQVFMLYDARIDGLSYIPPEQPLFREYVKVVLRASQNDSVTFWKKYLNNMEISEFSLPPSLTLPEPGIGMKAVTLSLDLSRTLEHLATDTGTTLSTIMQAAWAVVLGRYSNKSEVVFGVTKNVRHLASAPTNAVGIYINTLPIHITVDEEVSVRRWLTTVRERWTMLRPYEHDSISNIKAWCSLRGDTALFNSVLIFENGTIDHLVQSNGGNWALRKCRLIERTPGALTIAVYADKNIEITAEYDEKKFNGLDIERLLNHISSVLEGMATSPECLVGKLSLLSESEQRALLLQATNKSHISLPSGSVVDWFERAVSMQPEKHALEHAHNYLTYSEFELKTRVFAESLHAMGAGRGTYVGLSAPRSIEAMIGLFGILRAGAAYVPIDPAYPDDRIEYLCKDSGISIMASVRNLSNVWEGRVKHILYLDDPTSWATMDGNSKINTSRPEDPAYIIYTSGSTGKPKGVVVHHAALSAFISGAFRTYGIRPDDRILQFSSMSFDAAVEEIFLSLCNGLTLVLRTDEMLNSTSQFYEACKEKGVTILDLPTAFWNILASEMDNLKPPECVRGVIVGGEAMRSAELARWCAGIHRGTQLFNTYGPTETVVVATVADVSQEKANDIPIGLPLPGVSVYVLDTKMRLVPLGLSGELYIGGSQVSLGYLGRSELTNERFILNPYSEGRLYKSGDRVCYRDDGQLVYLGRQDRQIKLRGFRIELDEIEIFLRGCVNVKDAAVTVFTNLSGIQRVVGFIVPTNSVELSTVIKSCQAELVERMPEYMRPSTVIALERLPLNNSGKVDYKSLAEPEDCLPESIEDNTPRGTTEWRMAKLWEKVLGLEYVGRSDNFFELGGHSLLVFILLSNIEKKFNRRLAPIQLYQAPTIAELAKIIDKKEGAPQRIALHPVQPKGNQVPMFFVGSTDMLNGIKTIFEPDLPLYSLNIFGLQEENGEYSFKTVEDVASLFIREIRDFQPHGPYALGGYCRDTMIAFEMARQLNDEGEDVRLVAMVDIFWDIDHSYSSWERWIHNTVSMGFAYLLEKWNEKINSRRKSFDRLTVQSKRAQKLADGHSGNLSMEQRNALFINAYYDSINSYEPKPYNGNINIYMASEWGLKDAPRWRALCRQGVLIREVKACHTNLLKSPQAENLGSLIRDDLIAVGRKI